MIEICASNRVSIFVLTNKLLVYISIFFCSVTSYSQLEELEFDCIVSSGVLIGIDEHVDLGLIQINLENMDLDQASIVRREFTKYSGEIVGLGISVLENKILVSYRDPINPNFLLAILDRVNLNAHYLENGEEIFYVKDGNSSFIR